MKVHDGCATSTCEAPDCAGCGQQQPPYDEFGFCTTCEAERQKEERRKAAEEARGDVEYDRMVDDRLTGDLP